MTGCVSPPVPVEGPTGAEAGAAADGEAGAVTGLEGMVGVEAIGVGGRMSEP